MYRQLGQQIAELRQLHLGGDASAASEALKAQIRELKSQADALTDMVEEGNKAAEEAVNKYEEAEATIADQLKQLQSLHAKVERLEDAAAEVEGVRRALAEAEAQRVALEKEKERLEVRRSAI